MSTKQTLKTVSDSRLARLKPFLEETAARIDQPSYIATDPVCFMHAYTEKQDRALAGFFAALMAWGRRDIVLNKVDNLLKRMDYEPDRFIRNFSETDFRHISGFKHRTFKEQDLYWLIKALSTIMNEYGDFEGFWNDCYQESVRSGRPLMAVFHERFFNLHPDTPARTRKHIADPDKNSSCKRLWLYLRWCIRNNSHVDTGIMKFMTPAELMIPLDVHVARISRKLGLLSRYQNDWKSVLELTSRLRILDDSDPARYDYALFGLGAMGLDIPAEYIINDL